MARLVLLRHAQSQSNLDRRFAGWEDSGLTDRGRDQAARAGRLMLEAGTDFDLVYGSMLGRAVQTLEIVLEVMGLTRLTPRLTWRLNERHCGAFQGRLKSEAVDGHGRPLGWRTEFNALPPLIAPDDPRHPGRDPRYRDVDPASLPGGESSALALNRLRPLWEAELVPLLAAGRPVLVVSHGTLLRLLVRRLLDTAAFEQPRAAIPNANPLVIDLAADLTVRAVDYLDPARPG